MRAERTYQLDDCLIKEIVLLAKPFMKENENEC